MSFCDNSPAEVHGAAPCDNLCETRTESFVFMGQKNHRESQQWNKASEIMSLTWNLAYESFFFQ